MYRVQPFSNNGSTFRLTNVEKLTLKSKFPKIKSADVFKQQNTQNLHISKHFETFLMNPNLPNALIFGIKIQVPKTLAKFCNQKIKNEMWNANDSHISKVEPFLESCRLLYHNVITLGPISKTMILLNTSIKYFSNSVASDPCSFKLVGNLLKPIAVEY